MAHDSCHVWNAWGHTDLIKFPYMSTPPFPLSACVFYPHWLCLPLASLCNLYWGHWV